jgi:hypothetical protein
MEPRFKDARPAAYIFSPMRSSIMGMIMGGFMHYGQWQTVGKVLWCTTSTCASVRPLTPDSVPKLGTPCLKKI